jgi:hypothetical protein
MQKQEWEQKKNLEENARMITRTKKISKKRTEVEKISINREEKRKEKKFNKKTIKQIESNEKNNMYGNAKGIQETKKNVYEC